MAISSGRRGNKPYEESEETAEENYWLWLSSEDIQPATAGIYTSKDSYSGYMGRKCPVNTRKTYNSGRNCNFGGASNFPRKNFNWRRI